MLEEGTVVRINDKGSVLVELERKSSCGVCSACFMSAGGEMNIEAGNPAGAGAGDRVKLDIKAKGFVLGIIMVYLLPALGLLFGIIFGSKIDQENLGILIGVIFMLLFFMVARYYGKRRILYSAEIVEVIQKKERGIC